MRSSNSLNFSVAEMGTPSKRPPHSTTPCDRHHAITKPTLCICFLQFRNETLQPVLGRDAAVQEQCGWHRPLAPLPSPFFSLTQVGSR